MAEARREFATMLKGSLNDEVVIPILRSLLYGPTFSDFEVPVGAFHTRIPDGYFHPSTHPTWGERQLYYYLLSCQGDVHMIAEPMDPLGTLAVTLGNFWHTLLQTLLGKAGMIRVFQPKKEHWHDKVERFVKDEETLSRGWMDGQLNSDVLPIDTDQGLELKTAHTASLATCPRYFGPSSNERIGWLKIKYPGYYAQAQEYLRMSGLGHTRIVMIGRDWPFQMIEIAIPFDHGYSQQIVEKYRRVIQAVKDRELPDPCCSIGSIEAKACPARGVCSVGMMS